MTNFRPYQTRMVVGAQCPSIPYHSVYQKSFPACQCPILHAFLVRLSRVQVYFSGLGFAAFQGLHSCGVDVRLSYDNSLLETCGGRYTHQGGSLSCIHCHAFLLGNKRDVLQDRFCSFRFDILVPFPILRVQQSGLLHIFDVVIDSIVNRLECSERF